MNEQLVQAMPMPETPSAGRVVHVNDKVEGAVYVGRAMPRQGLKGSPLANPFKVAMHGRDSAIEAYNKFVFMKLFTGNEDFINALIAARGKPLACWCRHDGEITTDENVCHADELIDVLSQFTDDELRELAAS